MKKLSVILPAYNKDTEVFEVVSRLVFELKHINNKCDWEIIVVDDASQDHTLREAVRSKVFNGNALRIKIYSYNLNLGKGFALYHGFKKSSGDVIVFADSDLDLPSTNLPVLLSKFENNNADIVIGSKRHPLSTVHYPLTRKVLSKCYQLIIKALFSLNVSDTQVGLKVFRREVLENCFPRSVVKKFAFDLELLVIARMRGFNKIEEAPIILNYNFSSTINFNSIFVILVDTLAIFYRKNILKYYHNPHNSLALDEATIAAFQTTFI